MLECCIKLSVFKTSVIRYQLPLPSTIHALLHLKLTSPKNIAHTHTDHCTHVTAVEARRPQFSTPKPTPHATFLPTFSISPTSPHHPRHQPSSHDTASLSPTQPHTTHITTCRHTLPDALQQAAPSGRGAPQSPPLQGETQNCGCGRWNIN